MVSLLLSVKISDLVNYEDSSPLTDLLVSVSDKTLGIKWILYMYIFFSRGHCLSFIFKGLKIQGSQTIFYR